MNLIFLNVIEDDDDKKFILSLYQQYYPLMKKKAYSIVGISFVDDLIQDAFLKLIPKIPLLRTLDSYKVASYVVNTVKHICFDYIRKETRRIQHHFVRSNEDIG